METNDQINTLIALKNDLETIVIDYAERLGNLQATLTEICALTSKYDTPKARELYSRVVYLDDNQALLLADIHRIAQKALEDNS